MPFLEQRRRPHPIIARQLQYLSKLPRFIPSCRYWALTWSSIYIASFTLGGWLAHDGKISLEVLPFSSLSTVFVFCALFPALLAISPKATFHAIVWLGVFSSALLIGFTETSVRNGRRTVFAPNPVSPSLYLEKTQKILIRTTGWASPSKNNTWRQPAVLISQPESSPEIFKNGDGIIVSGNGNQPGPGQIMAVGMRIATPVSRDLPGMFDYRLFLAGRGIQWSGKILDSQNLPASGLLQQSYQTVLGPFRQMIINQLNKLFPAAEASLTASVLLGAKNDTSRAASSPFADLGLAHLFAVSGLHVGILLGLVLLPGKFLGISPLGKLLILLFVLPPYALLTGLPGSVIRAAGLALIAGGSRPLGRIGHPLHFLGFLFWITTIWQPLQVLDTGVKLSYLAAGGILGFTSIAREISYPKKGWRGFLLGGIFISLAAQWFTLPLAAASFGRISLISPLANLIAVPAFGVGVWLTVLALVFSPLPFGIGEIFSAWAWLFFRALAGLVNLSEKQTGGWNLGMISPHPWKILAWIILSFFVFLSLNKLRNGKSGAMATVAKISLAGILLLFIFSSKSPIPFQKTGPEIWQFQVGQGDCALLKFPDGWKIFIDTGGRYGFGGENQDGPLSRTIYPWLKRSGGGKIDAVLLTHGHLDHTGGAVFLNKETEVSRWIGAGNALECLDSSITELATEKPTDGEILHRWQDWSLRVYYPPEGLPTHLDENDHSLVVALLLKERIQFLWSGDLERSGEALLLKSPNVPRNVNIWKAGHHGSNTSGSPKFLDCIRPHLILISCGTGNSYHHPSHGFYVISGDTVPVIRTDLEGSIHLNLFDNGQIRWESKTRKGIIASPP